MSMIPPVYLKKYSHSGFFYEDTWEISLSSPSIKNTYAMGWKIHLLLALATRKLLAESLNKNILPQKNRNIAEMFLLLLKLGYVYFDQVNKMRSVYLSTWILFVLRFFLFISIGIG